MIEQPTITFGAIKEALKSACASAKGRMLEPAKAKEVVSIVIPEGSRFGLKYSITEVVRCAIGVESATIDYVAGEEELINMAVNEILRIKGVEKAIREKYSKYYSVENLVPYTVEPKENSDFFMSFDLKKF